jgi:hypothetical protein
MKEFFTKLIRNAGIKFFSRVPVKGTLRAEKVFPDGSRELIFEKRNLITITAKQVLLSSLYIPNLASDPIVSLQIGTGGCIDPEGMFPKPISQVMTSLFTPLLTVPTSFTINNAAPSVTFIADVDQGTANGAQITEAGLYKASNMIFNLKTFPAIPKTSEFSIHFEWEVEMA